MLENPTATSLVQGERSLFPKSFLRPEMSTKEADRLTFGPKIVLSKKGNAKKKKKHSRNIALEYSCLVFSTN